MPFTHTVNLGAPGTFSEVDMFLQSLNGEESSDADSYDYFSPDLHMSRGQQQSVQNGSSTMRSQMDAMPQGAFDPHYLNSQPMSKSAGSMSGALAADATSNDALRSLQSSISGPVSSVDASPQAYNGQSFGPQSIPLDQMNSTSFGSSYASSDPYNDTSNNNNSPFDLSDAELRPSITNDTELTPQIMIKTESDGWNGFNNNKMGKNLQGPTEVNGGRAGSNNSASVDELGPINLTNSALSFNGVSPSDSNDSRSSHSANSTTKYASSNGKVGKPKKERTSHNVIEKKYRTNINNKIVLLKEIIPSLCVTMKREEGIPVTELDQLRLDGLQPAKKLNKASILVKTIEYIQHLENKVENLKLENDSLRQNQTFSTPLSVRTNSTSESLGDPNSSTDATPPYRTHVANAYPNDGSSNNSFRNKMLMGGMALTMGANCFTNDSSDFQTVRGLMAMPVFHYSPMDGFTVSNSNGNVNIFSAFLSLFRLFSLFYCVFLLISQILVEKQAAKTEFNETDFVVNYVDSMKLNTNSNIIETLKKTLFVNRLKYPENSMERIENEIMKCFAIKLWKSPFKILLAGQVEKTWVSLTERVNKINSKPNVTIENKDWKAITNILEAELEETLDNDLLLTQLSENKDGFGLSSLVQFINTSIINQKVESVINEAIHFSLEKDQSEPVHSLLENSVKDNKEFEALGLTPVLECILHPTKENIETLTDKFKLEKSSSDSCTKNDLARILHACMISSVIADKKFDEVSYRVKALPVSLVDDDLSLLSVFALYLALNTILANADSIEDINNVSSKLEHITGRLRIWIGSSSGNTLQLDTRGKLVDFLVDSALKFKCLVGSDVEASEEELDEEFELNEEDFTDDDENTIEIEEVKNIPATASV